LGRQPLNHTTSRIFGAQRKDLGKVSLYKLFQMILLGSKRPVLEYGGQFASHGCIVTRLGQRTLRINKLAINDHELTMRQTLQFAENCEQDVAFNAAVVLSNVNPRLV
jgi:hypothetical protein